MSKKKQSIFIFCKFTQREVFVRKMWGLGRCFLASLLKADVSVFYRDSLGMG